MIPLGWHIPVWLLFPPPPPPPLTPGGLSLLLQAISPGLLFHSQEWSTSNFSCSLTRNIPSHSMENLAFHILLRSKMIILPTLTTSLIHFSLKGWENVLFELRSERGNLFLHRPNYTLRLLSINSGNYTDRARKYIVEWTFLYSTLFNCSQTSPLPWR